MHWSADSALGQIVSRAQCQQIGIELGLGRAVVGHATLIFELAANGVAKPRAPYRPLQNDDLLAECQVFRDDCRLGQEKGSDHGD